MPVVRGSLKDKEGDPADGIVYDGQISDAPDDAIVVDFRADEETLNWTKYGPRDSRKRFSELSDDEARKRLNKAREDLRALRTSSENADQE